MSIILKKAGSLTTIQDLGRTGYQNLGFSVSGAMDTRAFTLANLLLSNEPNNAMLEVTLIGPHITFKKPNCFVLTGAPMGAMLNQVPLEQNKVYLAKINDELTFRNSFPSSGVRSYIAFAGGLSVPKVMGSRSTYLKGKTGGYFGRAMQENDKISFENPKTSLKNIEKRCVPEDFLRIYGWKDVRVRVILGPQDDAFTKKAIDNFLYTPYTITPNCDRMGSRLNGEPLNHIDKADIISDGIAKGSVQVPSNGQPIILLADRQSIGGYTKIATVISADLHKVVQRQTGDRLFFEAVDVNFAQKLLIKRHEYLNNLAKSFN